MKRTILGFFKKEFIQALRDPKMRALLFIAPVIQMTIFGLALKNEVKNVRLSAIYKSNDTLLNNIYKSSIASGWFIPAKGGGQGEENDPVHKIRAGLAEVVMIAPSEGLSESIAKNEGRLQILIDSANILRARAIENYLKIIINREIASYTGAIIKNPFEFDVRILYNPTMETSYFLVPGVMCLLVCVVTIMLTSMSIAKEKEIGTFETLVSAPISVGEILIGKTFPFFVIGSIDVPLIASVAILGFGVPMRGSYLELAIASIFFVITTVSIGTLISTICRNQQQAMMGGFMFMFPAILLSGLMFPLDNMPHLLTAISYLNPLKYYMTLLRNIMLKGGDPTLVWTNIGVLVIIAVIAVTLAYKRFRLTLE